MRARLHYCIMAALAALCSSGAFAQDIDASIVERAQLALEKLQRASGNFVQIAPDGDLSSGRFYLRRPGRVRFEYSGEAPLLIVSDGVTVSVLDAAMETFDRIPLNSTPLKLFLGKQIDLKRAGLIQRTFSLQGRHFITMADPERKTDGYLTLEFNETEFTLRGWAVHDRTGALTRVILKDVRTDKNPPAALFLLEDPEDERER